MAQLLYRYTHARQKLVQRQKPDKCIDYMEISTRVRATGSNEANKSSLFDTDSRNDDIAGCRGLFK